MKVDHVRGFHQSVQALSKMAVRRAIQDHFPAANAPAVKRRLGEVGQ